MLIPGVHTPLRIDELLQLKWSDVYDEHRNIFLDRFTVTEQKTGRQKIIVLDSDIKKAFQIYLPHRKSKWIFVSRNGEDRPICRRQASQIIRDACAAVGISGNISCYSLRKTFGYMTWLKMKSNRRKITEVRKSLEETLSVS